jgi:DNA (cytosine-5)-methyltransferase 1
MAHLGDITKLNGGEIEPVEIITFGSPCQDLSVAGLRAGLQGKHSSLFMQAIRIIKEMRIATKGTCPARIVWENVPGAFSANGGGDFQKVIEEIAGIAEKGVSIPRPPKKFGWLAAGGIMGDNWSLAWRIFDAKYWGVPQRRRRIFLVADFGTQCAGEILFKQENGVRYYKAVGEARESSTAGVERGVTENNIKYTVYVRGGFGVYRKGDIGSTIRAREENSSGDLIVTPHSVRRLTPLEYERLQGYPDYWTLYGHDGRVISDGQRYKALGNSIAIPCLEFIMERISGE